jgi:hypothetical protein
LPASIRTRATVTFVDENALRDALDGWRWRVALQELDNWLRDQAKYQGKSRVAIEEVRARLRFEAPRDLWE